MIKSACQVAFLTLLPQAEVYFSVPFCLERVAVTYECGGVCRKCLGLRVRNCQRKSKQRTLAIAGPNPFQRAATPSAAIVLRAQSRNPEYVPDGAD